MGVMAGPAGVGEWYGVNGARGGVWQLKALDPADVIAGRTLLIEHH